MLFHHYRRMLPTNGPCTIVRLSRIFVAAMQQYCNHSVIIEYEYGNNDIFFQEDFVSICT